MISWDKLSEYWELAREIETEAVKRANTYYEAKTGYLSGRWREFKSINEEDIIVTDGYVGDHEDSTWIPTVLVTLTEEAFAEECRKIAQIRLDADEKNKAKQIDGERELYEKLKRKFEK